jgi:hypothetical protein
MRRSAFIIGLIAAVLMAAAPAEAQGPRHRFHTQLRTAAIKTPAVRMTTAMAGKRLLAIVPDAKLLRAIRLPNGKILVVFRRANRVDRMVFDE